MNENIAISDLETHTQFYKLPKYLIDSGDFRNLSLRACVLYTLIKDRMELSIKNNWEDEHGAYIYYTVEELTDKLRCSVPVVIKTKKELINNGLLEERRQFDKPNKIYLKKIINKHNVTKEILPTVTKETLSPVTKETLSTEIKKFKTNKTDINKTDINKTDNSSCSSNIYNIDLKNLTTATATNNSQSEISSYYQSRIGFIDSYQFTQLIEYLDDGFEVDVIKEAISKGADSGRRTFNYVNSILRNWRQNGITTMVQVRDEQNKFIEKKANTNKRNKDDYTGKYDTSGMEFLF